MPRRTRFTHPLAVDVWDTHFRWRLGNDLRERTIDETWSRVATFAADAEGSSRGYWARRYIAAFRQWQLIPDERLLMRAGTGISGFQLPRPAAILNASAFVLAPGTEQARFDNDAFAASAALAVRFLDGAMLATATPGMAWDPHIGMLGVADALTLLGLPYASKRGTDEVAAMASAVAYGSLQASVALASERGAHPDLQLPALTRSWRDRGMPSALIKAARRHGTRHRSLTAIEPHPLLARLANGASDALDPKTPISPATRCQPARPDAIEGAEMLRQSIVAMRRAVQPWIDVEIG